MPASKPRVLYQCTIQGQPITKKNSNRVVTGRNGRPYVIPSAQFEKYQAEAIPQLKPVAKPIECPCNVCVEYHVRDLIRRDLVNLLAATCDILVAAHILVDDNWRIVYSHDGSKVIVDRPNPRAVITITARDDVTPWWATPRLKDAPKCSAFPGVKPD